MKITKEELFKIAEQSSLTLNNDEAGLFVEQIKTILDYSDQLQQVGLTKEAEYTRNINVFREDVANSGNAEKVVAQAPVSDGRYFVVPKILD